MGISLGDGAPVSGLADRPEATFENWQSEFLQLLWQVAGLMFLFAVGSPQSREGDERKEEKLDWIMRQLDADRARAPHRGAG